MSFSFTNTGSFAKTQSYLQALLRLDFAAILERNGQRGVTALAAATPVESGRAAHSWRFKVEKGASSCSIFWYNTDVENGFQVAIRLQLGYGTGTGGYVAGRDYINPAMRPVFDAIEADIRKAVTSIR